MPLEAPVTMAVRVSFDISSLLFEILSTVRCRYAVIASRP
jgi:hypothetical protein